MFFMNKTINLSTQIKDFFRGLIFDKLGIPSLTDSTVLSVLVVWLIGFFPMLYGVIWLKVDWKAFAVYGMILFLPLALKYGKLAAISKGIEKAPIPGAGTISEILKPEE